MRFVRTVSILLLIFVAIVGGVAFYFYHQFPPEKVQRMAQAWLAAQLNRTVQVRTGSIQPLLGFQLQDVQIYRLPPNDREIFIRCERIQFRYSWRALLQRRIEVTELILDRPQLKFYPEEFVIPTISDPLVRPPLKPSTWLLALKHLVIRDGAFWFNTPAANTSLCIAISKLQFALQEAELQQKTGNDFWQNLNYRQLATLIDGTVQFTFHQRNMTLGLGNGIDSLSVVGICHAELQSKKPTSVVAMMLHDSTTIVGKLQIHDFTCRVDWRNQNRHALLPLPTLQLQWQGWFAGDFKQGGVNLNFALADWLRGKATGSLRSGELPQLLVTADGVQANLAAISKALRKWAIFSNSWLNRIDLHGQVVIDSLSLAGNPADASQPLNFRLRSRMLNLSGSGRSAKFVGMNSSIQTEGQLTNGEFNRGGLNVIVTTDSLLIGDQPSSRLLTRSNRLSCQTQLGKNGLPKTLLLALDAQDIGGAVLHAGVDLHNTAIDSLPPQDFRTLIGTVDLKLTGVDLTRLAGATAAGLADLHLQMTAQAGSPAKLAAELNIHDLSAEFDSISGLELLPDLHARLTGFLNSSPGWGEILFDHSQFTVNDLAAGSITAKFRPAVGAASIYCEELKLNLPAWQEFFPMYLREEMTAALWQGEAVISSELSLWNEPDGRISSQLIGDLRIDNGLFDNPFWYLRLDSLSLNGTFGGNLFEQQIDLEGKLAQFQIIDSTPTIQQTRLRATLGLKDWNQIKIQSSFVEQPQWQIRLSLQGSIDSLATTPTYALSGSVETHADSIAQIMIGLYYRGDWSAKFSIFSLEQQPTVLHLRGWVNLDTVDVLVEGGMMLHGLRGRLPFSQLYNLTTGYLEPVAQAEHTSFFFNWFDLYEPFLARSLSDYNLLTADSLYFSRYKAEDLRLLLAYDKGNIIIPQFSMKLYEGNFLTRAWLNLNSGALADISYQLRGQLSRVNSAILPSVGRQKRDKSHIGVSFDLNGKGVDLTQKINLEGDLEVTEIGVQTTDNLLRSIDPVGTDASIRSVKQLIKLGYKPSSLSFQIQHDNFYPQISFAQPWYSPIHIAGGKVAISRLPVKLILDLMAAGTTGSN